VTSLTCKACSGDRPTQEDYITNCGETRAYLHEDQFFAGWTVPMKRHATELFPLSRDERARLVEEVALSVRIHRPTHLNPYL
jgi:diadenosine tetraphosphate (Ap4A) HIT family hydrolase